MKLRLLTLTGAATLALAAPVQASCIYTTSSEKLKHADGVFTGRVLSFRSSDGMTTFRVLSVRKGRITEGSRVRVYPDSHPSSVTIAWTPRKGQRWRLYVRKRASRLETNDCMGSRRA